MFFLNCHVWMEQWSPTVISATSTHIGGIEICLYPEYTSTVGVALKPGPTAGDPDRATATVHAYDWDALVKSLASFPELRRVLLCLGSYEASTSLPENAKAALGQLRETITVKCGYLDPQEDDRLVVVNFNDGEEGKSEDFSLYPIEELADMLG